MSVSRKLQRQKARESERASAAREKASRPRQGPPADEVAKLRRRMRVVLVTTTLGGLLLMKLFNAQMTEFLQANGVWARVGFVLVLLAPALFTLLVGLGQLRDKGSG